jgi:phospholipid N-methyltransferase
MSNYTAEETLAPSSANRHSPIPKSTNPSFYLRFVWAGLVKHAQTGGFVPSQRFLIDRMIEAVPRNYCGHLVELGAGNGALTLRLAARCSRARVLACELNPVLARDARRKLEAAGLGERVDVVSISAEQLLSDSAFRGVVKSDYIISGIPLGNLGRQRAVAVIDLIARSLASAGCYIQFQHSLLDRSKIQARFSELRTTFVLRNFPPALVYYARRPVV